jgi:hypothetical protein
MIAILGAKDPEMDCIEKLLTERGIQWVHAIAKNGDRVHAGNAYTADAVITFLNKQYPPTAIFIECAFDNLRFDHHNPNDDGYGKSPELFWQASSIGQLWAFLYPDQTIADVPKEMLRVAAMDHCFNAAIQGLCPNVSKEEVLETKIQEIAKATGARESMVLEAIEKWTVLLQETDVLTDIYCDDQVGIIAGKKVFLVKKHTGVGYSLSYLTAQTAATLEGYTIIIRVKDTADALCDRLMLCGNVTEEMAKEFMEKNPLNLKRVFGNPSRGYAGGYEE